MIKELYMFAIDISSQNVSGKKKKACIEEEEKSQEGKNKPLGLIF